MPNHYHLMVRQCVEGGITEFMRKVGTGYTNYFNLRYNRVGPLFQGKFKSVLVEREEHFLHLPHYIHLNPLELIMPSWKEKGIGSTRKALDFLETHKWSSLPDYLGRKNFPSLTSREFLRECIGSPADFREGTISWAQEANLPLVQEVSLEEVY